MVQSTQIQRYRRYLLKKVRVTVHGVRPSALLGRVRGPRVLLNSIPKSGTHLLERALEHLPPLRNAGRRTLLAPKGVNASVLAVVGGISRGQFLNGHIPFYPELDHVVRSKGIRMLLMTRDPRDVAVSLCKYLQKIDQTHRSHPYMAALANDEARLTAAIEGVPGVVEPTGTVFRRYLPWAECDYCLLCRFEDLVGAQGGGSDDKQRETLAQIGEFLEIPLAPGDANRIAAQIFSTKSSTFNKGKIQAWRSVFTPEQAAQFASDNADILRRCGYEA